MQPGTRLGPYEIVARIGAGGMGEVYRARDARLGRDVAIKVLLAEFASDPERLRRFEFEARAVAALNHPNILALYDVGTHEGSPYLVTELLEGTSLGERLRDGAVPIRSAVDVGVQIALGLAAAHDKGIVHRDLKPANVFIMNDGRVKILDFGIAKLAPSSSPEELERGKTVMAATNVGFVMGTIGYVSPEQLRGQAVEPRSDIFSFGCVLYEMLSGRSPFLGDTPADTISAILASEPLPLIDSRSEVPAALQGVVNRCLEKTPEGRFQSARDLANDLSASMAGAGPVGPGVVTVGPRRWPVVPLALAAVAVLVVAGVLFLRLMAGRPSAPATSLPRIVVLPFENLGASEDAYFASGMAEEITSRLANVQGLGVISRTTAVEYDRKGKTVKQIGSDLGVDYVLEGSVRWEHGAGREGRVRITPQLIRVADDTHVWADRYDRVIADVFAIQSEVAESAVKAMGATLLPREQTALREVSTTNLQAYDLYLRGKELASGGEDSAHVEGALRMYQAAIDRDPHFAQALAGLARMHLMMCWLYYDRSEARLASARETAERAVELRPDLAETHIALGYYFYQGLVDFPRALSEFSTALTIQPSSSDARAATGYVLRRQGRWRDAAEAMGHALGSDPKNAGLLYNHGEICELARRYADADRSFGLAMALSPLGSGAYGRRAWLQVQWHGDVARAQATVDEARVVAGDPDRFMEICGYWAIRIATACRDYAAVFRLLDERKGRASDTNLGYRPVSLLRGQVQEFAGQEASRGSFAEAQRELEQKIAHDPSDARFHSALGIAYAGLGRREEAVREAQRACDFMPTSKDAWRALHRVEDLAVVYAMAGRSSEALATLERLLAGSGEFTVHLLRLDPRWDPLRSDPRFQALLTKYEIKP
ncbi:MAG: protein kinase [Acidobacteriia bacterium]|nr:protein kinase [Terriglobia bacterium]